MSYYKCESDLDRRDNLITFRASTEDRLKAEAVRALMQAGSTSEVFRTLLNEKATELGVN